MPHSPRRAAPRRRNATCTGRRPRRPFAAAAAQHSTAASAQCPRGTGPCRTAADWRPRAAVPSGREAEAQAPRRQQSSSGNGLCRLSPGRAETSPPVGGGGGGGCGVGAVGLGWVGLQAGQHLPALLYLPPPEVTRGRIRVAPSHSWADPSRSESLLADPSRSESTQWPNLRRSESLLMSRHPRHKHELVT